MKIGCKMTLSAETINNIEKYDDQKRLTYFLKEVVVNNEIWILTDKHGCVMLNNEDEDCVPVWPNEEFAQSWATGEWQGFNPTAISLAKWHSRWSHGLADDEISVVVFPNQNQEGLILYPEEFDIELTKSKKKALRNK